MDASPRDSFLTGRHLTLGTVLLAGIAIAIWSFQDARAHERERIQAEFERRSEIRHALIREVLGRYEDALFGLSTLFMVDEKVSTREFQQATQRVTERTPGAIAFEWVALVPGSQRVAAEELLGRNYDRGRIGFTEMGADGRALPAGNRTHYLPITYIEPLAGNEAALGLDLLVGRTAASLQQARDARRVTLSSQVTLVQAPEERGLVMISPVWRADGPAASGDPGHFEGYVQAVFLTRDLLERTSANQPDTLLDMLFVDWSDPDPARRLLYYRSAQARHPAGAAPTVEDFQRGMALQLPLPVGGRDWQVFYRPRAGWVEEQFTPLPWVRTGGVLLVTALIAGLVQVSGRRTELIEREVEARTNELRGTKRALEEDIARRVATEGALKASEARLQDIVDHSPTIIFVKDNDGRYLLCNQPFADFCGRPRSAIIGRRDEDLFSADDARMCRKHDDLVRTSGRPMEFEERAASVADPNTYLALKFPLRDAAGRIYALCGISTNISPRKQAEQEKLAIERKLLAAQKLESLGVLAGGIAHDFNNILTSVLANASLARHDAATGQPVDRSLQQIENAARRAADLCQQMLAYAGKGKIVTDRIDLSELVRETAALLEVTLKKSTRLDLRLGAGLPPVLADPTQLRQIVMNLVINAGDAITGPSGVITVTTFAREADATLLYSSLGNPELPAGTYAGLEVRDNGCGMTPETIARIFEPFFTTKFSGRGLGLSAVLGIVQSHRGALFVESSPGLGSTFLLLLPATTGPTVASAAPFPAPTTRHVLRGTALVVDDEEAVRGVAGTVLEMHGASVLVAPSGEAALELMKTHGEKINLVLLDVTMPGIDGEETLRRMRMRDLRQPVILMSGYSETDTMQRCAGFGVVRFVQKPFELETLLAAAKDFLA